MKNQIYVATFLLGIAGMTLMAPSLAAETFILKDGTSIEGQLVHYFDGVATVKLENGDTVKISRQELTRIDYSSAVSTEASQPSSPTESTAEGHLEKGDVDAAAAGVDASVEATDKADQEAEQEPEKVQLREYSEKHYRTPKTTFKHWRVSLLSGDLEGMASCFVTSAQQPMLEKLKAIPTDRRDVMIEQTRKTDFKMFRPKIKGDRATMRVRRKLNDQKVSEIYNFQREDSGWKIIPK